MLNLSGKRPRLVSRLLSLAGAVAVGSMGKVLAVEPTPQSFDLLVRAIECNGLSGRVTARRIAAGAREETRSLYIGRVLGHNSLIPPPPRLSNSKVEVMEIDVAPLDEVASNCDVVDVVKIDVEGAELEVLAGMRRIIERNPGLAIIVEFGPSHLERIGTSPEHWLAAFAAHGYERVLIDESSGHCRHADMQELMSVESVNVVFLRPNSRAMSRLWI